MSIQDVMTTGIYTDRVSVEGDELVFDVRGTGAPIILLPGTPGDASAYGLIADPLAADHTVITYDPRGFGRSTGNAPRQYEIGQQARDVRAVLRAAGVGRALVFGNSAGALVGLELAKHHPELIDGFVAHEPPVIRVLPDADDFRAAIAGIYRTAWTEGAKPAFFDFLALTQLPFNAGKPFSQAEVDALRPNLDALPGLDFADFYVKEQMLPLTNYAPALAAIKANGVKVVAGAGELSLGLPFGRTSRRVADELGVPFVTFPGHHGSHTDPATADAWLAVLREALAAL
ncbi:alpha/beta fold hydrolase [Microbacterium kyungheense]|uniref:Pimeloyl-ACP methyl ester carboxylesterase n=1 Tax=Microbacterium kyungheense TaxID=1263636 RepID=A0A543EFD0_9MICO|nr:alpha/beta hydrolase [Microbacterium kyungheense]TQM20294.1 pimeloyl-ACP methyl ester carboxylesterase [Microbacterium kyungheense]